MAAMDGLYIGLISGTSVDGIDAALVRFKPRFELLGTCSHPYPDDLRQTLLGMREDTPHINVARLDARVGDIFAKAAARLLETTGTLAASVCAIGSHGQTTWHDPDGDPPTTTQIGDPNIIAEHTGITTVADPRRRDLARGGEGAPLAPAFHQWLLREQGITSAGVLNLGGIANLTVIDPAATTLGFDTGPASTLMDAWCRHHTGQAFDADGAWAASGTADQALLSSLLTDDYFQRLPPKSTGPEHFSMAWLVSHLDTHPRLPAQDVQATLLALTVITVRDAVKAANPAMPRLLVCGGGAHNAALMRALQAALPDTRLETTAVLGLDPDWVEAAAFAWIAARTLAGVDGVLASVTGAKADGVLGGIYPGRNWPGLMKDILS